MKKPAIVLILVLLILGIWRFAGNGSISGLVEEEIAYEAELGVLSAGEHHVLAISSNGDLYGWGKNISGLRKEDRQLGREYPNPVQTPTQITSSPSWKFVHAGTRATYAITNDNTLWEFTYKHNMRRPANTFTSIFSGFKWTKARESWGAAAGLDTSGKLWIWSHDDVSGLWPNTERLSRPNPIELQRNWIDFCMIGAKIYAVASDGSFWKSIEAMSDESGDSNSTRQKDYLPEFTQVPLPAKLQRVICRQNAGHIFALDEYNYLWGFGKNSFGELGNGDGDRATRTANVDESEMKKVTDRKWIDVAQGSGFTIGIAADGSLWGWGTYFGGVLGIGEVPQSMSFGTDLPRLADDTRQWVSVAAGNSSSVGVTKEGEVYTWGAAALGDGGARWTPTPVHSDIRLRLGF